MKPRLIVIGKYRGGLTPVGHAKIQFPKFALHPAVCLQFIVGIIGIILIDYRAYKVVVGRRLDTKSQTFVDAAKPYKNTRKWFHSNQ